MQSDLPHRVFAYGTLKQGEPNYFHLLDRSHGRCRFVGSAQTEKAFPLVIATQWNVPFLLHVPDRGQRIYGEVYAVDDDMLAWMDKFEGHPNVYHRQRVRVSLSSPLINGCLDDRDNRIEDAMESCRINLKEKLLAVDDSCSDVIKNNMASCDVKHDVTKSDFVNKQQKGLNQSATNCLNENNKHLKSYSGKPASLNGSTLTRSDSTGSRDSNNGVKVQKENKLPNRTTGESQIAMTSQQVDCWCYFLTDFPEGLLQEPMHSCYNGKTDHFVHDKELEKNGIVSIEEALNQYRKPTNTPSVPKTTAST